MNSMIKQPGAWIPIVMSLTVLAIMLIGFAMFGVPARQADEGTGAHLFQIWLGFEVLSVAFFVVKWLPQKPKQALLILAIQVLAMLAAIFPVFYFKL